MFFSQNTFRRALVLLSVLAVPTAILRIFTYWTEVDPASGFFHGSAKACLIYNVIGFFVLGLCLLLSLKKGSPNSEKKEAKKSSDLMFLDEEEETPPPPPANKDMLPDFAAKTSTWQGTLSAFCTFFPGFGFLAYALSHLGSGTGTDVYNTLFALLSALSGIYFIFEGLTNLPYKNPIRPFFALVPAFWCTLRMVIEYRDLARFVNKALYVGQFLFIISVLVFFLYRAQLLMGDRNLNRPNAFAFTALAVVFFGVTCRFPQLIAMFGDKMSVDLIDASAMMIDLAITLFAFMKIRTLSEK